MKKCEVCGSTELPGGGTACCHGTCIVCEDCMCSFCDSNDTCEKHCDCLELCYECGDNRYHCDCSEIKHKTPDNEISDLKDKVGELELKIKELEKKLRETNEKGIVGKWINAVVYKN